MARKKILVTSGEPLAPQETSNVESICLTVSISREFSKPYRKDLSGLFDSQKITSNSQKIEAAKFVSFVNASSLSGETKKKYVEIFEDFAVEITSVQLDSLVCDAAITKFRNHLNFRRTNKEITDSTYEAKRRVLKAIFSNVFSFEKSHFDKLFGPLQKRTGKVSGTKIDQTSEGKAYTKEDFREVLRFLSKKIEFFEKFHLKNAPSYCLDGIKFEYVQKNGNRYSRTFKIKLSAEPESYLKNQLIFYYMLIFTGITGTNQSPMLRMHRNEIRYVDGDNGNILIYITDNRKKKKGDPKPIKAKKRFKAFLERLLAVSKSINPDENALLFTYSYDDGSFSSIPESFITSQVSNPFQNSYLTDINGNKIFIGTRRLRNSYGVQFEDVTTRAFVLGNSSNVADKYYSTGNAWDNNKTLQAGMYKYQESLLSHSEAYSRISDERLKIPVVVIEAEKQSEWLKSAYADNTPSGGVCGDNVNSEEAQRNTRELRKKNEIDSGEEIRCQNFLGCLRCTRHVFVNSVAKVYELLSLQAYLLDSKYEYEAGGLFGSKEFIDDAIADIEWLASEKFGRDIVEKARQKIEFEGVSPIWDLAR